MRSSQRMTAAHSTLARRAISSVMQMVPELPAEVVGQLSGNRGGAAAVLPLDGDETKHGACLVYRHSSAGLGFFHQEDHGNHGQNRHPEEPEAIDIGQHGGLPLSRALDQGIGLLSCAGGAGSVGHHRA